MTTTTPTPSPTNSGAETSRDDSGDVQRIGPLLGATLLSGLAAGFFYTYEASVTIGLADVGDLAYVETFQALNDTIRNPAFGLVFFGTLPALVLAAVTAWRSSGPARRALLGLAPALYLCCLGITVAGNVPLNDDLAAVQTATTGLTAEIASDARDDFEQDWNRRNLARSLAAFASFASVSGALALPPRSPRRFSARGGAVGHTG